MTDAPAIVVIAKAPVPGRVKTRLCPPLTPSQAADLARASLEDTLDAVRAVNGRTRRVLCLDGEPGAWLPDGIDVVAQRGDDGLASRLAAVFDDVGGPTLVVGMDTPQVSAGLLADALDQLSHADAVLGRADDGGYWVIGLRTPDARVFDGVPMSRDDTAERQRERLNELGYRCAEVAPLRDIDDIDDARAVAAEVPFGRFGTAFAALGR